MFKKIFTTIIFLSFCALPVAAHPPSKISPQYDAENGSLLLEIFHKSKDKSEHYIGKVVITKNDESPIVKNPRKQPHPNSIYMEIPLTLEEGDVVTFEADSRKGGSTALTWEITPEILEAKIIPKKAYVQDAPTVPVDKTRIKPAVTQDPEVTRATHPHDPEAYKPAVTRNPEVAKPTHAYESYVYKPAVTQDPDVAKSAVPTETSNTHPAVPSMKK